MNNSKPKSKKTTYTLSLNYNDYFTHIIEFYVGDEGVIITGFNERFDGSKSKDDITVAWRKSSEYVNSLNTVYLRTDLSRWLLRQSSNSVESEVANKLKLTLSEAALHNSLWSATSHSLNPALSPEDKEKLAYLEVINEF